MENKTDLLKILLNKPNQSPSSNSGQFYLTGAKSYTGFGLIDQQITYNQYTIIGLTNTIYLYDENGKEIFREELRINNIAYRLQAMTVDQEGNLYVIAVKMASPYTDTYLIYLNNITIPNANGEYKLNVKKTYYLEDLLTALGNSSFSGRFWWTITKSPYDSTFLLTVDGNGYDSGIRNLAIVKLKPNFDGTYNYDYMVGKLPKQYAHTGGVFVSWNNDTPSGTLVNISADSSMSGVTETNVTISKVVFDFSNLTLNQTAIMNVSNFVSGEPAARNSSIVTENEIYLIIQTHNTTYETKIYKYITSLVELRSTGATTERHRISAAYFNRQFFCAEVDYNGTNYDVYFIHFIDTEQNIYNMGTTTYGEMFFIISNSYNIYYLDILGKGAVYIFGEDIYNGTPYFSDESVTPQAITLFDAKNEQPIFSRNLYNVAQVGNSITSTLQIPPNVLNDEIIGKERLLSITNTIIEDKTEEIEKNNYEELYINNIESFKVYSNENTYNQDCAIEIAKNIKNGFADDYKITNMKVNYKDNTTSLKDIEEGQIINQIGIIKIAIYIDKLIDSIELYDKNYTKPFVKIDMTDCELNKLYEITQKVKVE